MRVKTTQSTIARLEGGRGLPSTRTLGRFANTTGHRLKISFEPVEGRLPQEGKAKHARRSEMNDVGTCFAVSALFFRK